ncbi:uncharacterized protein BP5553_07153 [Venustampulla echinocandica]|uniref:Lysine-specific metallo-endopeptidase domain-containing protein n=1 Tax=Venustampulla echinocandica TaxID=2656787 RepID=A0A370TIQ4_9HELO|nr:uncharacterized protein BP5553_07153 [Venustampulla echinocandica]RDL35222.1 hypothetical protein BP5553_07153 [Venustampulla echinocandica]
MIAFLLLIVLGVLGQVAYGWGMHESCQSIEQPLKNAMTVAFQRATEAKAEIRKIPRDKHVDALVKVVFGSDDAKAADAAQRLEAIQWLDIFSTSRPTAYNVILYCSTDRITDYIGRDPENKGKKIGYEDPDRNARVKGGALMDDCRSENHNGDASTRALTINLGSKKDKDGKDQRERIADTIQLCPWYLRKLAGPPPSYDTPDELVKKAADVKAKNLLAKFNAKLNHETATPIDSLAGFEHVLLHEMTHSAIAGYSDDTPAGKCYGWKHSVKCQKSENADSLAYFALAVELVLHRGYTVNKDGTLQKLADKK